MELNKEYDVPSGGSKRIVNWEQSSDQMPDKPPPQNASNIGPNDMQKTRFKVTFKYSKKVEYLEIVQDKDV